MSFFGCDVSPEGVTGSATLEEMLALFGILKPKSAAMPLLRIGGDADGSYLVPDDLHGVSACFSPGVNKIKYFEDYLTDRYGIECHMCDFSCDVADFRTPLKVGKQTFLKKWLDATPGQDNISLEEWIAASAPEGDLLLQMDIEGAEYRNILSTPDAVLMRFRLIVLEVHGLSKMKNAAVLRKVLLPFFEKISRYFTCVHSHPNNCCGEFQIPGTDVRVPNLLELTFIRSDRFIAGQHPPLLPHPLDVSRNLPRNPPLFLSDAWCDYDRPLLSKVKMLEDRLEYQESVAIRKQTDMSDLVSLFARSQLTTQGLLARHADDVGGAPAHTDIARGRKFVLSSSYGASNETGVIERDGNYFFHTGFGRNEFIRIDLGSLCSLSKICIQNRLDGFRDRADCLFALLSETENPDRSMVFVVRSGANADAEAWDECEVDLPAPMARFVTILSPIYTALHFADVKIYGVPRPDR